MNNWVMFAVEVFVDACNWQTEKHVTRGISSSFGKRQLRRVFGSGERRASKSDSHWK